MATGSLDLSIVTAALVLSSSLDYKLPKTDIRIPNPLPSEQYEVNKQMLLSSVVISLFSSLFVIYVLSLLTSKLISSSLILRLFSLHPTVIGVYD